MIPITINFIDTIKGRNIMQTEIERYGMNIIWFYLEFIYYFDGFCICIHSMTTLHCNLEYYNKVIKRENFITSRLFTDNSKYLYFVIIFERNIIKYIIIIWIHENLNF